MKFNSLSIKYWLPISMVSWFVTVLCFLPPVLSDVLINFITNKEFLTAIIQVIGAIFAVWLAFSLKEKAQRNVTDILSGIYTYNLKQFFIGLDSLICKLKSDELYDTTNEDSIINIKILTDALPEDINDMNTLSKLDKNAILIANALHMLKKAVNEPIHFPRDTKEKYSYRKKIIFALIECLHAKITYMQLNDRHDKNNLTKLHTIHKELNTRSKSIFTMLRDIAKDIQD